MTDVKNVYLLLKGSDMPENESAPRLKKGKLSTEFWLNVGVTLVNLLAIVALNLGWVDEGSKVILMVEMAISQLGALGYTGFRTSAKKEAIRMEANLEATRLMGDNGSSGN